ncbi:APEX1 [Cordylochernes scorpioides]|uniref:exodeoxyribonuclease III n=1 Tax=Cordylochernes scorpioides TaxID=51811 RepID=A0ABY6LKN2_9ARAC|nr:APEX1 [Cordylochernes scorpioides]
MPDLKRKHHSNKMYPNKRIKGSLLNTAHVDQNTIYKGQHNTNNISENEKIDANESKSCRKNPWKIITWNVNGVRSWVQKGGMKFIACQSPDILCLQETRVSTSKIPETLKSMKNYYTFWCCSEKPGYAGVGMLTKEKPLNVTYGIQSSTFDLEGRLITAEFSKCFILACYVPNSGIGLKRMTFRMRWDKLFQDHIKKLDRKKPVILCGDLNVAHQEIDIARPDSNHFTAGFTNDERENFTNFLNQNNLCDVFRTLYPNKKGAYTYWSPYSKSRERNVGWRLDYFVVSTRLMRKIKNIKILQNVQGSDHCPVHLTINL